MTQDAPIEDLPTVLARAARLAAAHGVPLDAFMNAAWHAFVEQHPQLLEQLEAMQLFGQLEILRMQGRVASA